MKKKLSLLLVLCLTVFSLAACGSKTGTETGNQDAGNTGTETTSDDNTGDTIRLAFVGPQTGDNAEYGLMMKAAIQVAIDEQNAAGGLLGKQIEMNDYDDKNDATEAGTIAEMIVADGGYSAVLGHFSSGVAMAAAEIYQEAGIPLLNASAAHVDFAPIGDYIFRNNAVYDTDANTMLQIASYENAANIGILAPNSDAGVSVTDEITTCVDAYGDKYPGKVVAKELYEDGAVDFSAQIAKFEQAGVDAVYTNGAYSAAAPFLKQYRAINPDVTIILSAGCFSQEFLDLAGTDAEGIVLGTSFFYESAASVVKTFVEEFNAAYGSNPNTFCAQIYDCAHMVFKAIEQGNSADPSSIKDNLYQIEFDGASGKITFDENGNCPKQQVLLIVENGTWKEIPDVLLSKTDWEAANIK